MPRIHFANYAVDRARYDQRIIGLAITRTVGSTSITPPLLITTRADETTYNLPYGTNLSLFPGVTNIPRLGEEIKIWRHSLETAAQGAVGGSIVGAVVGLGLSVPLWPVVLGGGLIGALAMGVWQYNALKPADLFDKALVRLAEIAQRAETPGANLTLLREEVSRCSREYAAAGVALTALATMLDGLLRNNPGPEGPGFYSRFTLP